MPFKKGNQFGKANAGKPKQPSKRTLWLLESLQEHGFDYEATLVKALKAGDFKLAELLIRMVPHIANQPKQDIDINGIETLVVNRYRPEQSSSLEPEEKPD
jgi:hypothetical protein